MNLFRRIKDPVSGEAQVLSATTPAQGARMENATLELAVTIPGAAPYRVTHRCLAKTANWPRVGQTLPVTVDRAKPERLRIEWDRTPGGIDPRAAHTAAVAEALRRQGAVLPGMSEADRATS